MKKYGSQIIILLLITGFVHCKKENSPETEKKAIVFTIAGSGVPGFLDTTVVYAKFSSPLDVAVHSDGTLYVTDQANFRVRKISTNGIVSTWAGNGNSNVANGNGVYASFKGPGMIALDASGNAYVSDYSDTRLRKITPTAEVSVYAGTATPGFADGTVATAQFNMGWGACVDGQGNVVIADISNNRIRKISTAGQVTTLAGSGVQGFADSTAALAKFFIPLSVAIDKQGNIYVVDTRNYRIRKITPGGIVSTLAGSGTQGTLDGNAAEAQFNHMSDIAIDSRGNLYVTDNHCVRKITSAGFVTTIAGSQTAGYADGEGTSARFNFLSGLAIDADGNIYLADTNNSRIRKIIFE